MVTWNIFLRKVGAKLHNCIFWWQTVSQTSISENADAPVPFNTHVQRVRNVRVYEPVRTCVQRLENNLVHPQKYCQLSLWQGLSGLEGWLKSLMGQSIPIIPDWLARKLRDPFLSAGITSVCHDPWQQSMDAGDQTEVPGHLSSIHWTHIPKCSSLGFVI